MNDYPEVVATIVDDYMQRLKLQFRSVPARDQDDFLREIQSHVYEAYRREPGEDDVAKILGVLRRLGEPADVVSDRLPEAMVRSGTKRNLPMYVLAGVLIAFFGLPLGFGAIGVLVGILAALTGVVVAYYAAAGSMLLVGLVGMLLGLTRMYQPALWDRLVVLGVIEVGGQFGEVLEVLSPSSQGMIIILFASIFAAAGLGLLWLGKYLFRGLRFLYGLVFDWLRRLAQSGRRILRQQRAHTVSAATERSFSHRFRENGV